MFEEFIPNTNYFEYVLGYTDGQTFDSLEYGLEKAKKYSHTVKLFNYVSKDCEAISSKLYNSQFRLQGAQHSDVSEKFFSSKFRHALDNTLFRNHDVLLTNFYDNSKNLQIIFKDLETIESYESKNIFKRGVYLLDSKGDLVQTTDIIGEYLPIGKKVNVSTKEKNGVNYRIDHTNKFMYKVDLFKNGNNYNIFKSSAGDIAFTTSQDIGSFIEESNNFFGIMDINDTRNDKQILYESILKNSKDYNFKNYIAERSRKMSKINLDDYEAQKTTLQSIKQLKINYFDLLSKEMFNSWKLSNIIISSRIPAQAGQSFMSMKVVGYMHENENSIYVSH